MNNADKIVQIVAGLIISVIFGFWARLTYIENNGSSSIYGEFVFIGVVLGIFGIYLLGLYVLIPKILIKVLRKNNLVKK